jgi:hypothetical protein
MRHRAVMYEAAVTHPLPVGATVAIPSVLLTRGSGRCGSDAGSDAATARTISSTVARSSGRPTLSSSPRFSAASCAHSHATDITQ